MKEINNPFRVGGQLLTHRALISAASITNNLKMNLQELYLEVDIT